MVSTIAPHVACLKLPILMSSVEKQSVKEPDTPYLGEQHRKTKCSSSDKPSRDPKCWVGASTIRSKVLAFEHQEGIKCSPLDKHDECNKAHPPGEHRGEQKCSPKLAPVE